MGFTDNRLKRSISCRVRPVSVLNAMYVVASFSFLILLTFQECYVGGSSHCASNWLDCGNGKCVAEIFLCDADDDCGNFKDEIDCDKIKSSSCLSSQFECLKDQHCIPNSWLCDGEHDCMDGTDEKNCDNITSECTGFRCHDQHCIPTKWHCDGHKDCPDGSDEVSCPLEDICSDGEFMCSSGSCLNRSLVCDGKKDCSDGTDEGSHCGDTCINSTCSHKCKSTPTGPQCYCEEGYLLDKKDLKTCVDSDECQNEGTCSHNCSNVPGSYKCSCLDGYQLVNNTCLAKGPDPLLLFSTLDEIRSIKLRSGEYSLVRRAAVKAAAVDADPTSQRIYWIEIGNKSIIYSAKMDGSDMRPVLSHGLLIPEDIAVDYIARNFYITDSGLEQVLACKMDGTMCHVLHANNILKPRSIVVDPSEGLLYWSDWSEASPGIFRSGMDGSQRMTFVSKDISWPNGIAIDHTINRLYWADAKRNTIEYISLDGNTRKVLLDGTVFHPYSLAVFEDYIYWSDWSTFSLESCNKFTGHQLTLQTRENGKHIMGVHVYHPVLASRVANPCWSHDCSHMCLITPTRSYVCACPPGFSIGSDPRNCKPDHEFPSLFVSEGSSVYYIRPEAVGNEAITELPLPLKSAIITRVAFDSKRNTLFVADINAPAIHAVNLSSLHTWQLVKNHIDSPEDLAFDANSNNLYWVDSSKGTVEVTSVGQERRVVLIEIIAPVAIAISSTGFMFVATVGTQSITMCDMDGRNQRVIPSVQGFPLSLAVHPSKSLLYWADPVAGTISFINFANESAPQAIASRLEGVMSVVVSKDYVYWTVRKRELHLLKQNNTHVIQLPGQDKGAVVSRKATFTASTAFGGIHPCTLANGGCSYLCLLSPRGKSCMCRTGMILAADNLTCVDGNCAPHNFKCVNSGICLTSEFRCDGRKDCNDGSDEIGCETFCSGDDFKCRNGRCILNSWRCDQRDDCGDKSDEEDCEVVACADGHLLCGSGECIPTLWRCDGESDCSDGVTDEADCNVTLCDPESQRRCGNGQCVPISWVCDGSNDCFDGSDESDCPSAKQRTCSPSQFRCESDGSCIDSIMKCDARPDCDDGSDERGCPDLHPDCKNGMFSCKDGSCLYDYEVCDGRGDCPDSADENNCSHVACREEQKLCPDEKRCIMRRWICDGDADCLDGSDEEGCTETRTHAPARNYKALAAACDDFFCYTNSRCLEWSKICDGYQDCADLPDEGGACSRACERDNGGCAQRCQKTPRGSKCFCFKGFRLLPDNKTCDDVDECLAAGTCSHYCNNTKGGFKCSCAEGYLLHHDHRTCKADGGAAALVYLLGDQIRGIDLVSHTQRVYIKLPEADMRGMDYDAEEGKFYWTEGTDGSINNYSPETSRQDVVLKSKLKPIYVKFDWIAKNIYFTNKDANIQVCSKDGRYCCILLKSVTTNIDSLDLSPTTGQMFWTTWSSILRGQYSGLIERAEMDGSHRLVIVSDKTMWPTAITVDQVLKMIYWTDVKLNTLEVSDFQGFQRRQIVGYNVFHPYALAVFEDFVYWADWGTDSIIRCNKFNGKGCSSFRETNVKAEVLMIIHKVMQPKGVNRCRNSNCPHLCLTTRTDFVCKCADGYEERNGTCELTAVAQTGDLGRCPEGYCLADGECSVVGTIFTCKCKESYSGPQCNIYVEPTHSSYDYSWIVAVLFTITVMGVIVLVFLLCKSNREKLHRVSESVTVKFRNQMSGREGHRLVGDTDDGGACDELILEQESDYKHSPFGGGSYKLEDGQDGNYKRWPSYDTQTIGDRVSNFFGRLGRKNSSEICK